MIRFYPIQMVHFYVLCKAKEPSPTIASNRAISGHITYDPSVGLLGRGTFKTAQQAELHLSGSFPQGLGSSGMLEDVALKRLYIPGGKRAADGRTIIKRYSVVEEMGMVEREASIIRMAASLLEIATDFIKKRLAEKAPDIPPFSIPTLRFVLAGIAVALKDIDPKSIAASSTRAVYLVEELILEEDGPFRKYVHNEQARPLMKTGHRDYVMAQFLCFIQHIQYNETRGLAFISDFQGDFSSTHF